MKLCLPVVILFFILYSLFFIPPAVLAQEVSPTISPSETVSASGNPIADFINNLISAIKGRQVDTTMQSINEAKLPLSAGVIPAQQSKEENTGEGSSNTTVQSQDNTPNADPVYNAASQYAVASWIQTPKVGEEKRSTNLSDFFADIIGDVKSIAERGDKKAIELADTQLPMGVAKEVLSGQIGSVNQNLAQGIPVDTNSLDYSNSSAQVLGDTTVQANQSAMVGVLSLLQCGHLPFSLNNQLCQNIAPTKIPESGQTPTPSLPSGIPSTTPGPAGPTPTGTSAPVSTKCPLGTDYCSVAFLKPFFGNDEEIAKQASQICYVESGGNSFAINKGCLTGVSVDYSVGLFQINLLAHCSGAFSNYSWNPPSCTIGNSNMLAECENKYFNVQENIKKALEMSNGGKNWSPWGAAKYCGIT